MHDVNKTAMKLSTEFDKLFGVSNTQLVINIRREFEEMTFKNDEDLVKQVEKYHSKFLNWFLMRSPCHKQTKYLSY